MSNRYDADVYLAEFSRCGRFPAIHDTIVGLVADRLRGSRVLDLCCSTGLLGERLRRLQVADHVFGVDEDMDAIRKGQQAGVRIEFVRLSVKAATLPDLASLVRSNGITAVVARRCLPELLGGLPELDGPFADTLADAGVCEIFLEGRVVGPRAVNRLKSIDDEVRAMSGRFVPMAHRRACCYLVAEPVRRASGSAVPGLVPS